MFLKTKKLIKYISPVSYLGTKDYSIKFALVSTLLISIASELFAYLIVKNPDVVGGYIIFVNLITIIFFAFRNGINAGIASTLVTLLYYFYIIYTRHFVGERLISGIQTTLSLGLLYGLLAFIIGYLKQKIDVFINREASEKRWLQAIIDQLPVGVVITGNNGEIIQVNSSIKKILGKKIKKGFVVPVNKENIVKNGKNKSVNFVLNSLSQVLSTGRSILKQEMTVKNKTGKENYLQLSAVVIRGSDEKIIAAASIISDITAQKELEKRKDDFINMASHELKTPLTSMKLYADSLSSRMGQVSDSKFQKAVKNLKYQTGKLQDLISDLLDVSRIQSGKLVFTKEIFNINDLLLEAIEDLQSITKIHSIVFTPKVPVFVYADRFRIYQVIANLLTNAIKYSPDGGEIKVKVKRSRSDVVVSVKDLGIGIEKSQQRRIFDRLYQIIEQREKTFPSLGMGLYISKEIIKRHEGKIWVESKVGRGSTFFFLLPLGKNSYPFLTK